MFFRGDASLAVALLVPTIVLARNCKKVNAHSDPVCCVDWRMTQNWPFEPHMQCLNTWFVEKRWYTEKGCGERDIWQCSLCCEDAPTPEPTHRPTNWPTPVPTASPKCAKLVLDQVNVRGLADVRLVSLVKKTHEYNRCRLNEGVNGFVLTRSKTKRSSRTYSLDSSLTSAWGKSIEDTVTVEANFGIEIPEVGSVGGSASSAVTTSENWSKEKVSGTGLVVSNDDEDFQEETVTKEVTCPANKICTYTFDESESVSTVRWEAQSHCIQADGSELDNPKTVSGTFKHARNKGFSESHVFEDCPALRTVNGCLCQGTWTWFLVSYSGCAQPPRNTYKWCYVVPNDPNCDYSQLGTSFGEQWDRCDDTVGSGRNLSVGTAGGALSVPTAFVIVSACALTLIGVVVAMSKVMITKPELVTYEAV